MDRTISARSYCDSVFDGTHDTPKPVKEGMPLVTSKHIKGRKLDLSDTYYISHDDYLAIQKRSKVSQWDILFSMIGSVGEVYLEKDSNIPYAIKNIGVFSCKDEYKAKWLYYYLQSPAAKTHIKRYLAGAVQKFLSLGALRDFPVLPYNTASQSIIDVLFSVDQKIDINNRINSELEAMAKKLYDYWFVQFDFPDENGKPYKSSGGKMEYNPTLKRYIPAGWEVSTLSCLIGHDKTGDWGKDAPEGNYTLQVSCIRGADINGINGLGDTNPPTRLILEKNSYKILSPYEMVVEISGGSPTQSTGRLAFVTESTLKRFDNPLICSNFCKVFSLKQNVLFYWFIYSWNSIYENGTLFDWEGKTSGIKNLLFDSFVKNHSISVPPQYLAKDFSDCLDRLQEKKQFNLQENQQLTQLRDWLLPMLMNGQVKIKDA